MRWWTVLLLVSLVVLVQGDDDPADGLNNSTSTPDFDNKDEKGHGCDDDDDDDDDDDSKEHHGGKKKHHGKCEKKKVAKIIFITCVSVAVCGTAFGILFCCIRHRKRLSKQVSSSKTNILAYSEKAAVYQVPDTGLNNQKTASFPVVSTDDLPGKKY